jgi:hypothetical protein
LYYITSGNANVVYAPKWLPFLHNLGSKSSCSCIILIIVLHNLDRKNRKIRRDPHWTGDPETLLLNLSKLSGTPSTPFFELILDNF